MPPLIDTPSSKLSVLGLTPQNLHALGVLPLLLLPDLHTLLRAAHGLFSHRHLELHEALRVLHQQHGVLKKKLLREVG